MILKISTMKGRLIIFQRELSCGDDMAFCDVNMEKYDTGKYFCKHIFVT